MNKKGKNIIVLGSGVVGLSSALCLAEAGYNVTVWSSKKKDIVSYKAGAFWWPSNAIQGTEDLIQFGYETFRYLVGLSSNKHTGVICHKLLGLSTIQEPLPPWHNIIPGFRLAEQQELRIGYFYGQVIERVPVIIPEVFMPWLKSKCINSNVKIIEREANSIDEVLSESDCLINCTGLGARDLCNDSSLRPMSGQLLKVITATDLDTILFADGVTDERTYIIPHTQGEVILGGTTYLDDWNTAPDENASERILERCQKLEPKLNGAHIVGSTKGLRPWRSALNLAMEKEPKGIVVHNYGHGGSGYSLFWGCANKVVNVITKYFT